MKKRILLDLNDIEKTVLVTRALSSDVRLRTLQLLHERSCNITEIAEFFDLPISTIANHIRVLEDAGLISTSERPGVRGSQKVCGIAFDDVYFSSFEAQSKESEFHYTIPMRIGHYYNCEVSAPCGVVSAKEYIGTEDEPSVFFANNRVDAQLLWFHTGYVEYRFPLTQYANQAITALRFTLEICSEAPGFNNQWPSDIDIHIQNHFCGTIHSEGDFGGIKGTLNPSWWSLSKTQYGMLHEIKITESASFIDGVKIGELSISDLDLSKSYISFCIELREDAENAGGINIFGEAFGNHPQAIQLEIMTKSV